MVIREFYYNEECKNLYIEFSVENDDEDYYRVVELDYSDVFFYHSGSIEEDELSTLEEDEIIEILNDYFFDNDLPKLQYL